MKMKLKVLFSVGLFLLIFQSIGNTPRIEFTEFTLANGLHVILHHDNTTPNVIVNIMYHVGSKNDHPERTGFAHFFEHLMFEGTKHIGRGEFDRIVESSGGDLNAFTSNDVTNYFLLLPSNQLELGLWLESERMLHPNIDSIGIATQKSVVTEEMQQVRDNRPYGRMRTELQARLFTNHPYKNDVLGKDPHIRNATDEDIVNFHKMFYVPNNAVLVVTGDIDKAQTKTLIEKYFGDIPRGTLTMRRPAKDAEPRRTTEVRDTVFDNVQIPAVIMGYKIPEQTHPDFIAVQMLSSLMSSGQSSRLNRRLIVQDQLALQVGSFALGMDHPGYNMTFAIANMGVDPADVEAAINEEFARVRNELISNDDLQTLRNRFENQFVNTNSTIANRAINLASYHLQFGSAELINTAIDKYMQVTREDIKRVANEYFRENNRVVLYWLPKPTS